jgi:hypothetical protein
LLTLPASLTGFTDWLCRLALLTSFAFTCDKGLSVAAG